MRRRDGLRGRRLAWPLLVVVGRCYFLYDYLLNKNDVFFDDVWDVDNG